MPDTVKLSDFAFINPATDTNGTAAEAPVTFIPMAAVAEGGGWRSTEHRPLSDARRGYTLFQRDDVIVAKITPCFENGKVALLSDLETDFGLGSTEFHVLRAKPGHDPRFIYHWTRHPGFLRAGEASMTGSAGQRRVPAGFFERFEIAKIEGTPQGLIADILDTIDDSILETDAVIEKLKAVGKGMAADLFCLGLDSNGELRQPDALRDTALGMLPLDWSVDRLDTVFGVFGGKRLPLGHTYSKEATGFRYLRVTDFFGEASRPHELPSLEARTFKALQRYEITDGALAVSIAGSIGRFHPFNNETDLRVILTENAARLEPKKSINPDFYARFLNSLPVQKQVELEIGTGGGVPKLALHRIQALKVVDVPRDEQDEISRRLGALELEIQACRRERAKLSSLREGLRDNLLTGRKPVVAIREAAE
ncbi:restriction endonuclease subunit S [Cereibacter changlensis]|uniref:Restriction endonuclease subunit S n=1 Tax=Cereibacter changlensis TaxID=402884 RepID=A0A4V5NPH2_9RHOB|nr:restriction endonuclease subunit S [Cereibacter changlensis]TKA96587.1 restriction endonuclease subunit S [Cereibacter changlensis]